MMSLPNAPESLLIIRPSLSPSPYSTFFPPCKVVLTPAIGLSALMVRPPLSPLHIPAVDASYVAGFVVRNTSLSLSLSPSM